MSSDLDLEVTLNVNGKQIRHQTMQELLMAHTCVLGAKKRSDYKYTLEVEVTIFGCLLRVQMGKREVLRVNHWFKHEFLEDVGREEAVAG